MVDIPRTMGIDETSFGYSKIPISRRQLSLLALSPILALAAGCSGLAPTEVPPISRTPIASPPKPVPQLSPIPLPQIEYPLEAEGVELVDKKLLSHPFLTSIKFSFDPAYSGGALKMNLTISKASEMRLATFEVTPNRGWIYCKPHRQPGDESLRPVVRYRQGDAELVHLGFKDPGTPCLDEYTGMRAYLLTRKSDGSLTGGFVGITNLNPLNPTFVPRDAEAAGYWQKECLT